MFYCYGIACRFHIGTLAFGSLLVAIIQFARAVAIYVQKHMSDTMRAHWVVKYVFCCINCCLLCLEKCMKYIAKNAYIQTAIHGSSFLVACKDAFFLIARNIFTVGAVAAVSDLVLFIAKVFVCGTTTATGYFFLNAVLGEKLHDLVGPTVMIMILSWMNVSMFMDVFHMGIDAIIMCYLTDR